MFWGSFEFCLNWNIFKTFLKNKKGWLAQLVELLVYTEKVGGSNPSPPTKSLTIKNVSLPFFNYKIISYLMSHY